MSFRKLPFLDVFTDASKGNIKTPQKEFLVEGKIPVVDQGQQLIAGYVNDRNRVCKAKSPVIVFGDHTKTIKYIDFEFAMGADGTKVLVPKVEANIKFLFYALNSLKIPDAGYSRHYKFLKEIEIPLPPLSEQKRIARILDAADALRTKRRESLSLLDKLIQSIFLDMFGDPATNPMGWKTTNLENFALKITDGDHHTPLRTDSGIKLLSAKNVLDGEIDLVNTDFVNNIEYERMIKRCHPEKGDILISCSGSIGRVSRIYFDDPVVLVRSAALVKIDHSMAVTEFVEYLLRTPALKSAMFRSAKSSSQANLFQKPIKNLPVLTPPLTLQRRFAEIVKSMENQRERMRSYLSELDILFVSLQQRAFNGKL